MNAAVSVRGSRIMYMTEINDKSKKATQMDGEITPKSAMQSSNNRFESNVINGYVLRAMVFDSLNQEKNSKTQEPIIEVP